MKADKRFKMTFFLLFPHLLISCFPMSSANEADAKVMLEIRAGHISYCFGYPYIIWNFGPFNFLLLFFTNVWRGIKGAFSPQIMFTLIHHHIALNFCLFPRHSWRHWWHFPLRVATFLCVFLLNIKYASVGQLFFDGLKPEKLGTF